MLTGGLPGFFARHDVGGERTDIPRSRDTWRPLRTQTFRNTRRASGQYDRRRRTLTPGLGPHMTGSRGRATLVRWEPSTIPFYQPLRTLRPHHNGLPASRFVR